MEEVEFKVYFNNAIIELKAIKLEQTEQIEKWKVMWAEKDRELIFRNNSPLLKLQNSKKRIKWSLIEGSLYPTEAEEFALALEKAIKIKNFKPYVSPKSW